MKKKYIVLAVILALSVTACNQTAKDKDANVNSQTEQSESATGDDSTESEKTDRSENQSENKSDEEKGIHNYEKTVSEFEKVSMKDVADFSDNSYFLYLGRSDCPSCRDFAGVLSEYKKENNVKVLYVNTDEKDDELNDFIKKQSLEYVPALFYADKSGLTQIELTEPYTLGKLEERIEKLGI